MATMRNHGVTLKSSPLVRTATLRSRASRHRVGGAFQRDVTSMASESSQTSASSSSATAPRVVVLGGGFGGLYTALRLDSLEWPEGKRPTVTVVDKSENFVFKPMLYELVNETMEPWEVAPSFKDLLTSTRVEFALGTAQEFTPDALGAMVDGTPVSSEGGVCALSDGRTLEYDYLVLALGTSTSDGGVRGAKECAIALNTAKDAMKITDALKAAEMRGDRARVAVIGGGLSGVELATVVAERLNTKREGSSGGDVDVITPRGEVMATAPLGQREAATRVLEKARVNVVSGRVMELTKSTSAEDGRASATASVKIAYENGRVDEREYDVVCWTVGQRAETPADWPVATTSAKKIKTDATLRVNGHSRIYAVGDASSSSAEIMEADWNELPSTAQVAFQQADYAAWNIWASINDRTPLPFRYQHLGDMMVLGSLDAAVAFPVGDITLEGPAAAALRRLAYLYRMPTNEHRVKLATKWISDGVEKAQSDPVGFFDDLRKALPNPFGI